jgi:flagellar biosynthetic protein FliR
MGLAMRIVFVAVEMAGELVGLQMGLGFATFFDPQHSSHVPVLAQLLGLLAALAFLAMDGHLQLIAVLSESFRTFPVGTPGAGIPHTAAVVSWGAEIFAFGLRLALPVLAALLITNLALGILTRMVPQLNPFAVGFPLTLLIGILMLALAMPRFAPLLDRAVHDALLSAALITR